MVRFLAGFAGVTDEDEVRGALEDFPDGGGEGIVAARLNSDQGADHIGRQSVVVAFVERAPGAIGKPGGFPAGDGRGCRGRELAVEGFGDDASQSGRDVDVTFVAQAVETSAQLRFNAALDVFVALHYMTCSTSSVVRLGGEPR